MKMNYYYFDTQTNPMFSTHLFYGNIDGDYVVSDCIYVFYKGSKEVTKLSNESRKRVRTTNKKYVQITKKEFEEILFLNTL